MNKNISSFKKKRLISLLKGHHILKKKYGESFFVILRDNLNYVDFNSLNNDILKSLNIFKSIDINLSIKQYLLIRFAFNALFKKILISAGKNKKLVIAIPSEYQLYLKKNNINISFFYCTLCWYLVNLKTILISISHIFFYFFSNLISICIKKDLLLPQHIFFLV